MQSLPENAYRELKPGEEYRPMMPAGSHPKEVTPYSVTLGVLMAIIFSAAAAYLGLKIGQVSRPPSPSPSSPWAWATYWAEKTCSART